jgi:hypothetical protein
MQSLVLHPTSLTTSQFGQFNSGPERLSLNRSWSPNARGCSPRAHLQSMSGSPEPEPAEPRGHPSPVATERLPVSELSQVPVTEPLRLPGYSEGPLYTGSPRPLPPTYPLPVLDPAHPGRSLAQKSTRRTKAHVASACVNCKKKHLGCDPARPCRRCVLSGKAVSFRKKEFHGIEESKNLKTNQGKVNMCGCYAQETGTTPVESRRLFS